MSGVSDRAASSVVSFVMTLGISSLLISGLLVGTGGYVNDQRESTIREELEVVGQQLAADLSSADRLVRGGGEDVAVTRSLPRRATGITYSVAVDPGATGDPTTIRLSTNDPAVTVELSVRTATPVEAATLPGGDLTVSYDSGSDALVVTDD